MKNSRALAKAVRKRLQLPLMLLAAAGIALLSGGFLVGNKMSVIFSDVPPSSWLLPDKGQPLVIGKLCARVAAAPCPGGRAVLRGFSLARGGGEDHFSFP